MTNQVNEVLEKIREVCDLKRLEFGCEVIKSEMYTGMVVGEAYHKTAYLHYDKLEVFIDEADTFEIIGLPVQLNHLLWTLDMLGDTRYESVILKGNRLRIITPTNETETSIEDGVGINNEQYGTVVNDVWADVEIDLTQSVEDNLCSNPELTKWVHGVIIGNE